MSQDFNLGIDQHIFDVTLQAMTGTQDALGIIADIGG
jgi:hypothetical protein